MAPHPLVNESSPEFSLPDANGHMFKFPPEEQGVRVKRPIALFFYPEAGTFGCTREACQFRDALVEKEIFKRTDVQVIGISSDPVPKQKRFVESQNLTYPVLSDEKHVAYHAFHVGKGIMGFGDARTTFVIDSEGIIRDSLSANVNYNAHVKFVTKALEKLESQPSVRSPSETSDADAAAARSESSDDSSLSQTRDELSRVAYVVCA
ncbi:thioredoxin-like protein [Suillus discolor]|uniref:thioredoxin-dependent peroxiredoxin n=1 Tax=Suillus discolor TaxID=1912936 RepID=A0A9P7EXQ9_9AGAM|nr:thioredoxin-like protein [Suillus discolor]KAG2096537.1 thioredoxin-like protein [Suillus discolor]